MERHEEDLSGVYVLIGAVMATLCSVFVWLPPYIVPFYTENNLRGSQYFFLGLGIGGLLLTNYIHHCIKRGGQRLPKLVGSLRIISSVISIPILTIAAIVIK